MKDTKVAVLGVGRMGQIHCSKINAVNGLKLTAGSSRAQSLTDAVKAKYGISVYNSHEKMLKESDAEWVVIATTTDQHKKWALEAINTGKNIIVEKPVALCHEDAKEIFNTAEKMGVKATVYQSRRWDLDFTAIKEILEEKALGSIYRIESRYTHFSEGWGGWGAQGRDNPWRLKRAYGGGLLYDWGPHLIDQIVVLLRESPVAVFGRLEGKIWTKEVDDHFWAELVFKNGITVRVEASNNYRIPLPRWSIVGTEGTLQVAGGDPDMWNEVVIRKNLANFKSETRIDIRHGELSAGFYPAFTAALKDDRPLPVLPDEVLMSMKVMDAIRESSKSGKAVFL